MLRFINTLIAIALLTTFATAALSQHLQTEQYLDFEQAASPQISPDGSRVLYVRQGIDKMKDQRSSSIWQLDANGDKHAFVVKGSNVKWSPSGDRIAFTAPDSSGNLQLFVRYMDSEALVSQITSEAVRPRNFAWSPDGKSIAFVARTVENNTWSVTLPSKPKGAKWTADPVKIDKLHYRQDRVGITNTGYDHIFVVPADGGTARQITTGEWNVSTRIIGGIATSGTLSWSGDGKAIYFDGQPMENADLDVFKSLVYRVDVATKAIITLTPDAGYFHTPSVSPNGKYVSYIGTSQWDSDSYRLMHLWVMNADGSEQKLVKGDLSSTPDSVMWSNNSKNMYFTYDHHGSRNAYKVSLKGKLTQLTKGTQVVSLASVSSDETLAMTITNPSSPNNVYLLPSGEEPLKLSNLNEDIFIDTRFGEVREIWYDSSENTRVQGWMVLPPNFDDTKQYPLILNIHGGPHAMYNVGFNFAFQDFAADGYIVLYTNPRGSTGYGAEFANAIQGIYPGRRDGTDLLKGVDAAIAEGFVDPERLFVTGCSGGGILTTYVVAATQRFKSAVSRCTVSNWISMAGTSDVPSWVYRFHEKPFWEDPSDWLANSPLMMVGKVETPMLLMTGEKDLRTPYAEAEQYFSALKMRGVPTRLVPMRGEYHGTGAIPSNWLRTQAYIKQWFEQYDPTNKTGE